MHLMQTPARPQDSGTPQVYLPAGTPQVHPQPPGTRRPGGHARPRRETETSEYVAMMLRIIHGYGQRIAADPVALVHLREIEQALRDEVNAGIWLANDPASRGATPAERQARRPGAHYSLDYQARMLGVSKPAMAKRRDLGEQAHVRNEAARSRGPLVRLADVRARRAARLAAVQLADLTGSERERLAR